MKNGSGLKTLLLTSALVLCTVTVLAPRAQEPPAKTDHVSHRTCRLCHNKTAHGLQWDIWRQSPHARAYRTLLSEASEKIVADLKLETPPEETALCLRCHVTAYDRTTSSVPAPLRVEDGVQCESCHGPGRDHVPDGRRHWMNQDRSVDTGAHIQRPTERTCVQCHRRNSPTWDPKRYSLPNGRTTGFDFQQAFARIAHPLQRHFADDFPKGKEGRD